MTKKRTNISIQPNVYKKAKELGINISQTAEEALQIRIESAHNGPIADGTPAPLGITLAHMDAARIINTTSDDLDPEQFIEEFEQACEVDWDLAERTTRDRVRYARKLVKFLDDHPLTASEQDLRNFLQQYDDQNCVKTVRIIYGRFYDTDLAENFKIKNPPPTPTKAPSKEELQAVYHELDAGEEQAALLLMATSGLRRSEILDLTPKHFDLENRGVYPQKTDGQATKQQWMSFYSPDTERKLHDEYDFDQMDSDEPLFTRHKSTFTHNFADASVEADTMRITPQVLRVWFCQEMSSLGVADRHIDAFCGRTSRSVLANHYSDYTPENLQKIYEDAGIAVLE